MEPSYIADNSNSSTLEYTVDDLKNDFSSALTRFGDAQETETRLPLRRTLQEVLRKWKKDTTGLLPNALLYPIEQDPSRSDNSLNSLLGLEERDRSLLCFGAVFGTAENDLVQPGGGKSVTHLSIGALRNKDCARVRILRELSIIENFEVFLTYPSPGFDHGGVDNTDCGHRHYLDISGHLIFTNFRFARQEILDLDLGRKCGMVRWKSLVRW